MRSIHQGGDGRAGSVTFHSKPVAGSAFVFGPQSRNRLCVKVVLEVKASTFESTFCQAHEREDRGRQTKNATKPPATRPSSSCCPVAQPSAQWGRGGSPRSYAPLSLSIHEVGRVRRRLRRSVVAEPSRRQARYPPNLPSPVHRPPQRTRLPQADR